MTVDLKEVAKNSELMEIGRKAVEDELIKRRDDRICLPNRGNGLVIKEKDGQPSPLIRIGMEEALRISLFAIQKHLDKELNQRRKP